MEGRFKQRELSVVKAVSDGDVAATNSLESSNRRQHIKSLKGTFISYILNNVYSDLFIDAETGSNFPNMLLSS